MGRAHLTRIGSGVRLLRALRQWVPGLRGLHCSRECPFRQLLGPHPSASSERSRGVRTTGKGTGARWCRVEQGITYSALSVGTVLEPPNLAVGERPRHCGQGLYHFTLSHKVQTPAVFPSSLMLASEVPRKSKGFILPGDFTCWDSTTLSLAGWPRPASGTLQAFGPLTTCWDRNGKGPPIAP